MEERTFDIVVAIIITVMMIYLAFKLGYGKCLTCGQPLYDWRGADVCTNKECSNYGLYDPEKDKKNETENN